MYLTPCIVLSQNKYMYEAIAYLCQNNDMTWYSDVSCSHCNRVSKELLNQFDEEVTRRNEAPELPESAAPLSFKDI